MDKDIIFNAKKFLVLLIVVLLVLFLLVIKAFEMAASNERKNVNIPIEELNTPAQEQANTDSEVDIKIEPDKPKKTLNITLPKYNNDNDIPEIKAPEGTNISEIKLPETEPLDNIETANNVKVESERPDAILAKARDFRKNRSYTEALNELQKIQNMTDNKSLIAASYQEIATIYAINRKYGTALSFASRAYNMEPNTEREMLLARIYYKSGDIDKATTRVNNVLHREFINDK